MRRGGHVGTPVFIGSAFVAQYPTGGGTFWVPLQYLRGLLDLGIDAWWLEVLFTRGDATRDRAFIDRFLAQTEAVGVRDRVVLLYFPAGSRNDPSGPIETIGGRGVDLEARMRSGILINMGDGIRPPQRAAFGRTVLFDFDPGAYQLWAREWGMGVGEHDVHVTIGRHLGAPDSPVPLGAVRWERCWPTVHLPSWPAMPGVAGSRYTTVTQWWNDQYAFLDGDCYDCNKRSGFLEMVDVPRRAGLTLELAANIHPDETADLALLARHGWRVANPEVLVATPHRFRAYVQASRGEFSCAKPAYVKARAGWISDRTVCYLATGRPCVVQATGAEGHLPATAGLRFFRTAEEAADALAGIERDWPVASRAARRLAEEVFATEIVLPALLAAIGA